MTESPNASVYEKFIKESKRILSPVEFTKFTKISFDRKVLS